MARRLCTNLLQVLAVLLFVMLRVLLPPATLMLAGSTMPGKKFISPFHTSWV